MVFVLVWLLITNIFLVIFYSAARIRRHENFGMAAFFLFLPGVGFIIYLMAVAVDRFMERVDYNFDSSVIRALHIDDMPERPDVRLELDLMPVADAMAVSKNADKRALLLRQMRKDLKENYKILMMAENSNDSESTHYVTATKMEICRVHRQEWSKCRKEYELEPGNPDKYHAACAALEDILRSGVFPPREQDVYRKRLCDIVQGQIDADEGVVSLREYEEYLGALAELGRCEDAERLWHEKGDRLRNEGSYMKMMKLFFREKEWQKMAECLDELRVNSHIYLSLEGLAQLRYWTERLKGSF